MQWCQERWKGILRTFLGVLPINLSKYFCNKFFNDNWTKFYVFQIVYFTVLFPYVVLCILLVRGLTLQGAWQGILFYILPDWGSLAKPKVKYAVLATNRHIKSVIIKIYVTIYYKNIFSESNFMISTKFSSKFIEADLAQHQEWLN